eukprot:1619983-Pyramimonas_sp.AAC.1
MDRSGAGSHAVVVGAPVWVFSAAPVESVFKVHILEDESVELTLMGQDGDGDTLRAFITVAPEFGSLHNLDGSEIVHAGVEGEVVVGSLPAAVSLGSNNRVVYRPGKDNNGPVMFAYAMDDGYKTSSDGVVLIQVAAVNDAPVPTPPVAEVAVLTNRPKALRIDGAEDPDGPHPLQYRVTTLPMHGLLYPAAEFEAMEAARHEKGFAAPAHPYHEALANHAGEEWLTNSGASVAGSPVLRLYAELPADADGSGAVRAVYVPDENFAGDDVFGYVVTDGVADSREVLVALRTTSDDANARPLAGMGGGAVLMDAARIDVSLEDLPPAEAFTVELWMRSSRGQAVAAALVSQEGAMALTTPFVGGVAFQLGGAT